ncbi:hypothetical protein NRF20_08965 [Streptomyces sp. R-74717]|uniref:hypothetical protein n=1 Tax=Streptomyces sp. R-74717 TaxID=2969820 RepID=UPI0039B42B2E
MPGPDRVALLRERPAGLRLRDRPEAWKRGLFTSESRRRVSVREKARRLTAAERAGRAASRLGSPEGPRAQVGTGFFVPPVPGPLRALPSCLGQSQTFCTALLRIKTGISDTRWAVIVQ